MTDKSAKEITKEKSQWLAKAMAENPHILAMRERTRPKCGGMSFANVVFSDTTSALSSLNRNSLLELIYQHFRAIGMNEAADTLERESGHKFQNSPQQWDKTDLQLLISLAISHNEDPWNIPPDFGHNYVRESIEEDNFAFPYKEDPNTIWEELVHPMLHSIYSDVTQPTYSNLIACSLKRIVVSLIQPQGENKHLPDPDQQLIFLTLHSMTSSDHFLKQLVTVFDGNYPEELKDQIEPKMPEIRSNIIDVIRKWINFHGLFIGKHTLKSISQFLKRILDSGEHPKLNKIVKVSLETIPSLKYGIRMGEKNEDSITVRVPEVLFRPDLNLLLPDPDFVAGQISTYQKTVFAAVHSLEFINAFSLHKTTIQTPTLNEFFEFGHRLQCLFLEAFLKEDKPEDGFSKLLKLAKELDKLKNYDAVYNLLTLVRREDVKKLGRCTESQMKTIDQLWETCGKDGSDFCSGPEPSLYEKNLKQYFDLWSACIPNMTAELHSVPLEITNQEDFTKDGLINWEKRRKIGDRVQIIYRFQNYTSYPPPVSQIQKVISSAPTKTFDSYISMISQRIQELEDH